MTSSWGALKMFEGIRRIATVWREAKKADDARIKIKRQRQDYEFLPAVIEVMETPASPVGRTVMLSIGAFLLIAALWAWFGKIDVVASASGKVIPTDYVKYIQSSEIGVVRAIHVRNGQSVGKGDVLIELDPTDSSADLDRLRQERMTSALEIARLVALLNPKSDPAKLFVPPKGATADQISLQRRRIDNEITEDKTRISYYKQEGARLKAQLRVAEARIEKLRTTLPYIEQQVEAIATLEKKGFASKLRLLELQQVQVESEQDIATELAGMHEARSAIKASAQELAREEAEIRSNRLDELVEAERQMKAVTQELLKAERRSSLRLLTAPVAGTVQQLSIHTVGGVVEAAKPLMIIVPKDSKLEVEAKVLNRDIGFVKVGQNAEIKLEAFPYTKYGVINGRVLHISGDAIADEQLGLVYDARIEMSADAIQVQDKMVNLTAGMATTVEVKTGDRRVLEYILTPLLRYKAEALRER
ncbi:HlyD family type I secretion periplasmic adaptor subunit [Sneathiella marina]|uniref:Membrane fusion protein (MFP) family protein n=1 Tax=Sneathiella marina TaxID=2950108 RepID=A0ABY4VYG6_9PROT|nr:HlyD family type I secretion periplasmic adaptor subunit [Sneathiella marina]USG59737.1 HlyD family type I secretion periplasmic adaptor subunit [Sneathiella marina]